MKVIVLGAGVIGVTTAYFLARDGHDVTVLEKNFTCGLGCSYANGGQLSYSHIQPWSAKSSLVSLLKTKILSAPSLSISDFNNRESLSWLYQFIKNSSARKSDEISQKIFKLTNYSREVMRQIMQDEAELKFDYKNDGILHFYRSEKSFARAKKELELLISLGGDAEILDKDQCVKKEPTLIKLADEKNLAGGIFYKLDASGNSAIFTSALEKICREKYRVNFKYNADIRNIFTNYQKITGINTNLGVFVADKYVYALGATASKLLKGIFIDPKIYPLKGYSLSIKADSEFIAPQIALSDLENRIVYSRLGNVFRAAGTVDFSNNKVDRATQHIDFLKSTIRSTFSDFGNFNEVSEWQGFRPFRPNSIPLICQIKKYGNFIINAGHGSLGWTMSAASAKIVSQLVIEKRNEKFAFLNQEESSLYIK
ncbi:MAG: FAD-dependent oxidoreductase [Rickettsiales bacterium]|nr:FAD-dependent oxidoreductase [Rickettsiales bacterium]